MARVDFLGVMASSSDGKGWLVGVMAFSSDGLGWLPAVMARFAA